MRGYINNEENVNEFKMEIIMYGTVNNKDGASAPCWFHTLLTYIRRVILGYLCVG